MADGEEGGGGKRALRCRATSLERLSSQSDSHFALSHDSSGSFPASSRSENTFLVIASTSRHLQNRSAASVRRTAKDSGERKKDARQARGDLGCIVDRSVKLV
jgi:hypothetical protein